jgi:hypothetical protein
METYEIVAQAIGIVAMAFNILSYQGKKQKTIILLQLFGGTLFAINYLMLGASVGGILNIIGAVRAIVFLFKDKLKADKLPWFIVFIASYIMVYILSFTVFGKEVSAFNLIIEVLPVIGMVALNIGFRMKNASDVRKLALISSPSWLTYNIVIGSWGAILCEIFTLISIFVGIFRHDKVKKS